MAVPAIFDTIESTGFSTWLRESESVFAFYFPLLLHTFGLSLLVGASVVVDLRILGVAKDLPLQSMKRLFSIMWVGFAISAMSGILLLIAYPTKALTNPVFYLKLLVVGTSVFLMRKINARVFGHADLSESAMAAHGRTLAIVSLALWGGAIATGRLLAYTSTYRLYGVHI
jgi:hypothetical protein